MPSWWWSRRERWEVWEEGGANRKTDRKSSREGKTARQTGRQTEKGVQMRATQASRGEQTGRGRETVINKQNRQKVNSQKQRQEKKRHI